MDIFFKFPFLSKPKEEYSSLIIELIIFHEIMKLNAKNNHCMNLGVSVVYQITPCLEVAE